MRQISLSFLADERRRHPPFTEGATDGVGSGLVPGGNGVSSILVLEGADA